MSFDLYFCRREPERIDFEAVAKWAGTIEYFQRQKEGLWYQNPDTGVYFSLDYSATPPDDPEESPVPEGCCNDSGLAFNLNYNRASFFGYEAMPLVERLAREFDLGIYNPQMGEDEEGVRYDLDATSLLNSWLDHNRRGTLALLSDKEFSAPDHMPKAKSLRMWRYMAAKKDLAEQLGEDVFVPKMVPIQHKESRKLDVAFVWSEGVISLAPEVDWVFIVRPKRGLFKKKDESDIGIISYPTFLELIGHLLQAFESEHPGLKIMKQESAEDIKKIISRCDVPDNRSDFKLAGMDSFIDSEIVEEAGQ